MALRRPGTGRGFDIEETFETIVSYAIEEVYEIADALACGNMRDFKEQLDDLLLQVVFQARITEERGLFDFGGVVEACASMPVPACAACGDEEDRPMCNLYSVTKGQQAIRELAGAMRDKSGNLPPLPGIFQDYASRSSRGVSSKTREVSRHDRRARAER